MIPAARQLAQIIAETGNRPVHIRAQGRRAVLTFADDVALDLALGRHAADHQDRTRQLATARDGALAFRTWAEYLVVAYFQATGVEFGSPRPAE